MMNAVCEMQLAWQTTDPVKNVGLMQIEKTVSVPLQQKKILLRSTKTPTHPSAPHLQKKEDEKMLLVSNIQ